MKLRFEIDCTPEEARQLLTMPGLAPLQDQLLAQAKTAIATSMKPEAMDALTRSWAPVGEAGLAIVRQFFKPPLASESTSPPPSPPKD